MIWTPTEIKRLRAALHLSQIEFAKAIECKTAVTVWSWETGRHVPRPAHQRAMEELNRKVSQ